MLCSSKEVDCGQSLFSSKIRWEERKTSKRASVTVSVTCRVFLSVTCERNYERDVRTTIGYCGKGNDFWFELSGGSKKLGFENSGFPEYAFSTVLIN